MRYHSSDPPPQPTITVQECWSSEGREEEGRCPKPTPRQKSDAGSVMLAGVAIASSCQIILPVFGILFLIVGTVLTLASYRGPELDEDPSQYLDRVQLTSDLRILGPCCLAVGSAMVLGGLLLCYLSRRASRMRHTFRCPIHGDFYPISSTHTSYLSLTKRTSLSMCVRQESEESITLPTPQCPHSNRSSLSNGHPPAAPSPLPPIITSLSLSRLAASHTNLEMTGSTHSLAVSYDVASFPHSRESSPAREEQAAKPPPPLPTIL